MKGNNRRQVSLHDANRVLSIIAVLASQVYLQIFLLMTTYIPGGIHQSLVQIDNQGVGTTIWLGQGLRKQLIPHGFIHSLFVIICQNPNHLNSLSLHVLPVGIH